MIGVTRGRGYWPTLFKLMNLRKRGETTPENPSAMEPNSARRGNSVTAPGAHVSARRGLFSAGHDTLLLLLTRDVGNGDEGDPRRAQSNDK